MFRRVFTASFAAANNTTSSSPSSNNTTTAQRGVSTSTTTASASLPPRADVDISEQKRLVARDKAERKAKLLAKEKSCSLYGALPPEEEARVMEFNRHSLRLLVLEAHNRQVQQTRSPNSSFGSSSAPCPSSPSAIEEETVVSPASSSSSSGSSSSSPQQQQQQQQQRRGAVTPPPEGHFDLTQRSNVANLLQDIDTLMAVAQQKPPQTRDRILNQTYEQVARLSLWNDLA